MPGPVGAGPGGPGPVSGPCCPGRMVAGPAGGSPAPAEAAGPLAVLDRAAPMALNGTRQELAARRVVALRRYRPGRDLDRAQARARRL